MAKIQIKNSFITSSAQITISSSLVRFESAVRAKSFTGSFSGSVTATNIVGTTNYIPKFTGTTSIGNSAIYDSSGNIGIGTTSPVAKLSVYTTSPHGSPTGISVAAGAGGANLLARDSNYHNWFPYTDGFNYYSADSHVFRSSNHLTNYVYINSNGNLGIGTTSPAASLEVVGTGVHGVLRNTSKTGYTTLRLYNDQNNIFRALSIDYAGSSYSGALITNGPTGESADIATAVDTELLTCNLAVGLVVPIPTLPSLFIRTFSVLFV